MGLARKFDGKKFMWDGREYSDEKECREIAQKYKDNGFEVEMVKEGGKYFLFTRRVVKGVVIEGAPPV